MSVKTFTEGGKGRKKCPADGCPHFVAAVTKKCPCGHEFVKGVKPAGQETKVITRYDTGGRGKKQCPGCKKYVGAKTGECPCGHIFTSTKPTPTATRVAAKLSTAATQTPEPRREQIPLPASGVYPRTRQGVGINQTAIPAGACPAKLKSTDKADVYEWIVKILKAKEDERHQLLMSALKYYAREFYSINDTKEYRIVCGHIESYWADGGSGDDFELEDEASEPESVEASEPEDEEEDIFEFED